ARLEPDFGSHPSHAGQTIKAFGRLQSRTGRPEPFRLPIIRTPRTGTGILWRENSRLQAALRCRNRRRVELQARTHGRGDGNLLDVVALGARRLRLDDGVGERTHVLLERL